MNTPETPMQKGTRLRLEKQQALMQFLHRKPSDCAIDVDQHVADAKARLKREKFPKEEIVPMRPADWQTAFHQGAPKMPTPKAVRSVNCKRVKKFKCELKDYGKAGDAFANKLLRARRDKQKFLDEVSYQR